MTDQEARQRYVRAMPAATVWIRQRIDGQWEAIDWMGKVVAFSKYRSDCEREARAMASVPLNCIYAVTVITEPRDRKVGVRRYSRRVK